MNLPSPFSAQYTLSTAATGKVAIGAPNGSANINISLSTAVSVTGVLSVSYVQNPGQDITVSPVIETIPINASVFLNGTVNYNWSNGSVQPSQFVLFTWVPTSTPVGTLTFNVYSV